MCAEAVDLCIAEFAIVLEGESSVFLVVLVESSRRESGREERSCLLGQTLACACLRSRAPCSARPKTRPEKRRTTRVRVIFNICSRIH